MKDFIHDDFLLTTPAARRLYHEFAAPEPILDYHNHLPPGDLSGNRQFADLTAIWLEGDHYKWRAMRANGVDEKFITGDAEPFDKFKAWAATVPMHLAQSALPLDAPGIETLLRHRRTPRCRQRRAHLAPRQRTTARPDHAAAS